MAQGRLALAATQGKFNPQAFVVDSVVPEPQSSAFRTQLEQAVINALANPVNLAVNGTAPLKNGKNSKIKVTLASSKTTASAILSQALARIPNAGPLLVSKTIESAVADNYGKPGTGLNDAYKAATLAMRSGLKTYVKGTRQWGVLTSTGPSLPNFTPNTANGVNPNLDGLMNAASAISANAVNALGASKNPDTVTNMTAALVKGAFVFQKSSQSLMNGTQLARYGGAVSAASTALVAQVAGVAENDWTNVSTGALLTAVVNGAMQAAKSQVVAVAYGAAAGFAGTFIGTGGVLADFDVNATTAAILASFQTAKGVTAKNKANVNQAILAGLNAGLNQANWNDPINGVAGVGGIKDFTVVNGTGDPLTDTIGL
jgi:hypothetical protein